MHVSHSIEPSNAIFADALVTSLQQRNSREPTRFLSEHCSQSSTASKDEKLSIQLKRIERNVELLKVSGTCIKSCDINKVLCDVSSDETGFSLQF